MKRFMEKPLFRHAAVAASQSFQLLKKYLESNHIDGFWFESDAIHSPNENFPLNQFFNGIEAIPYFYKNFAELMKKKKTNFILCFLVLIGKAGKTFINFVLFLNKIPLKSSYS